MLMLYVYKCSGASYPLLQSKQLGPTVQQWAYKSLYYNSYNIFLHVTVKRCHWYIPNPLQTLGECCTCVFASTDHSSSQTVLTTLLINWPSPAFQLYSHLTNTQPYSSELITSPFVNTQEREIETDIAIDQNTAVSVQNHQSDHHTEHSGRILSIPLQDVTNVSSTVKFLEDPSHTYFDQLSSQDHVPPFETSWRTISRHPITPLTGRGSYVLRLSPSCSLGALAVNYPQATDTEMLFFSPLANAELSVCVFPKNIEGLTGRYK